jgi:hypothetical protein
MTTTLILGVALAAVIVFAIVLVVHLAHVALRSGADADGEIRWSSLHVRFSIRHRP